MCEKGTEDNPIPTNQTIFLICIRHRRRVKGQYKIQEMCDKVVERGSCAFKYVSDQYKNKEMCDKAVERRSYA